MRQTYTTGSRPLTDTEVWEQYLGDAEPTQEAAEAFCALPAERIAQMYPGEDPLTAEDLAEVRAAVRQYAARQS